MEVFLGEGEWEGGGGGGGGWYHGCGARPVKISSQARISASPAARQREEIAADRVVRGWRVQPGLSVSTVRRVGAGGEQAVDKGRGGGVEGSFLFVVAASSDWRPGAAPTPVLP